MNKLTLKPGVLTGTAVKELFAYCKEADCALPAVNVTGSRYEWPRDGGQVTTCFRTRRK